MEAEGRIPFHGYETWWRSVEHSSNGFVTECFLDELAAAADRVGVDLLALRVEHRLTRTEGTRLEAAHRTEIKRQEIEKQRTVGLRG